MNSIPEWHRLSVEQVLEHLSVTTDGLSQEEALQRFSKQGPNELPEVGQLSIWNIFTAQFKNLLIVILLLATAASAFLGHTLEAVAITAIVLLSILLGFIQEYRAERAIIALRKLSAPSAVVIREGKEANIPARELVGGDIIMLHPGDKVPADARLIEAFNLKLNESSLTGESEPVHKETSTLGTSDASLGDRANMVYSGTAVVYGRGCAVVVSTATDTEFGKITTLLQQAERPKTPLQINLDRVAKVLSIIALAVVATIFSIGILRGAPMLEMLLFGIALAVAVVPEALPAVVTVSLALGVRRMVKRHALIRHLPTVETLGTTSIICADKTGTLTCGEMTVRKLWIAGQIVDVEGTGYRPKGRFMHDGNEVSGSGCLGELLRAVVLANEAHLSQENEQFSIQGDPTEGALVVAAAKAGFDKETEEELCPRVDELPFTSERKRMTTLHKCNDGLIAYSKGAPEMILNSCTQILTETGGHELEPLMVQEIEESARRMATEGLRVLAVAQKKNTSIADAERDMTFLGLLGMLDSPRPEASSAIATCKRAGIRPIMITGDHEVTATTVARELGVLAQGQVISGSQLDGLSEKEFTQGLEDIDVYARVSPAHKLRIVEAWQQRGRVVAMTGDGVNDAPALKKADVGVAMGITGTDVSKEAADMTLTDDNFASIVGAVEEGRGIFTNIKKYLMYLLSSNTGEICLIAGATLFGLPLPLTAVQILYVNLATDGLPALALAVDPPEDDLMQRPPRNPARSIFTRPVTILILVGGLWSAAVNLGLFAWALGSGRSTEQAMAMTFVTLVLIEFLKAYNFRSEQRSLFIQPFSNPWLNLAILWELTLLFLIVYVPNLQPLFGTFSLSWTDWSVIVVLALTIVPVLETAKWLLARILREI